ncbi:glutamine--fructose-6-phosphate transaminase (isomerizing) [Candidatus Uhrbacteria bacterium]|nr:glutamine--fructose-6-phosphate transaminase (isomerizing) [Candidatus Uhrbacteria bacterium]
MCGIVGYIGAREALPILMEGLHRLEYRGYDSAGVAIADAGGLVVKKAAGKITALESQMPGTLSGTLGIAHTRWATHGAPSQINAHPHTDCRGEIALAHNGIIENHQNLREWLVRSGHTFRSETDTEVLVHLIEEYYEDDLVVAVQRALRHVHGTYGIVVCTTRAPDTLVAARLGSPLVIGIRDGEFIVASDPSAIVRHTREVIYLHDGELAILSRQGYEVRTLENAPVTHELHQIDWSLDAIERGGYPHFMLKEINEEPEALENTLRGRVGIGDGLVNLGAFREIEGGLRRARKLHIVACGSAFTAGAIGEYMLEEYARMPVESDLASEFRYRNPVISPYTLVLAVSQSGETADTVAAVREAKRQGATTFGIVNVVGSTIAREVDAGMYNHAGPEIGVASTKAFISQIACLGLFTIALGRMRGLGVATAEQFLTELVALPEKLRLILEMQESIRAIARKYAAQDHFMYIGRKYLYPLASEGALKLKEISYIHAEGYAAGEMKHGPIALIDQGFPAFVLAPKNSLFEKTLSNLEELRARGAPIIAVTTPDGEHALRPIVRDLIVIPHTIEPLEPILAVVPLQLFAYEIAVQRGYDPDRPRNLAKSVTVE